MNPPAWEQAGSYPAYADRMTLCALMAPHPAVGPFAPRPGVRPSYQDSGLKVTQDTSPDMFVLVATGTAFVPATVTSNAGWVCHNNGTKSLAISAANASNPRIDIVIAHVYDAVDDSGSLNEWDLEVVTGTPAPSPAAPSAPTNSIVLAQVAVAANATSITNANITDERTWSAALGGIIPVQSAAMPSQPYEGMAVWQRDTNNPQIYDGGAWQTLITGGNAGSIGGALPVAAFRATDFSTGNTSAQTALSIPVGVGTYRYEVWGTVATADSTATVKVNMNGPATSLATCNYELISGSAITGAIITFSTQTAAWAPGGATTDILRLWGLITTTASGTLSFQICTGASGHNAIAKAGTVLQARQIG